LSETVFFEPPVQEARVKSPITPNIRFFIVTSILIGIGFYQQ